MCYNRRMTTNNTQVEIARPDGVRVQVVRKSTAKPLSLREWLSRYMPHVKFWRAQRQIIDAVEEYDKVAAATCHACAKTHTAGHITPALLFTCIPSHVFTTAPGHAQVKTLLWKEIRSAWHQLPLDMQERGQILDTQIKMFYEKSKLPNPKHGAEGRATNEPGRFQGKHAENMLVIVDEAAEVPDEMFGIIDTFNAAKELLIGNPTRASGRFYDAFHNPELGYHCIQVKAEDTPNFTGETEGLPPSVLAQMINPERVKQWAASWGESSAWYRSRVLAEFPEEDAEDVLVPEVWFTAAVKRELPISQHPEVQIGVDAAHFGTDTTAIAVRADRCLVRLRSYKGSTSTQDVVRFVLNTVASCQAEFSPRHVTVLIDRTGVGAGVSDLLTVQTGKGVTYRGIAFSETPRDTMRFANVRAEMYWMLREAFQPGGPGDLIAVRLKDGTVGPLKSQLGSMHYGYNDRQKVQIESKDAMRQRGMNSPDEADAVALAFAPYAAPSIILDLPSIKPYMPGLGLDKPWDATRHVVKDPLRNTLRGW